MDYIQEAVILKIGIPKGLFYFKYYPLWKTFFEKLDCEVVTSAINRRVLDSGVKLCADEACLPVKIYHGHVDSLNGKVDAIFIPRIVSIMKHEYTCPKFLGLPEMIKNSMKVTSRIIDTSVNLRGHHGDLFDFAMETGSTVTQDRYAIMNAFRDGLHEQHEFEKRLKECGDFESALKKNHDKNISKPEKIAILGHPYVIYDSYINMDITKKIQREGYSIITPQMIEDDIIRKYASKLPKRHFWTLGRENLGAGLSLLNRTDVKGIIYLSSFCCGIDSLMEDYLERQVDRFSNMPYMKLVLDEHTGEAGFDTRLEAFLDMVRWREKNENNVSTHG
jgi:predicted nucleotide-binding protein (sugar kinase/HSP70/actin superfamily)